MMISYRRSDSAGTTGRIFDHLVAHFGPGNVFVDVDAIPIGADFREYIDGTLKAVEFLIVVIGPRWLGERDDDTTRLDDPSDLVRIEVETGLRNGLRIVPILVDGATMPSPDALPESLRRLPSINAAAVDSGVDFKGHVDRLIRFLEGRAERDSASERSRAEPLAAHPNNLPPQLTSFVGREAEIAEIASLLGTHRLVTLTGSGGIGKTRTSLQVAASVLEAYGDGVWFVELAPLSSGEYIPSAIAQALGLTPKSKGDPIENIMQALKSMDAVLVLDNCEHLVEPAALVVSALLRGCPKIKVLASSRHVLNIVGEVPFPMPPLGVPGVADAAKLDALHAAHYPSTALFVERAQTVDKHFALTEENAVTIAEICRRLDGIPLAIELAAARVKMLSPRQLRERLDERFRVLAGGSRDALPRQRTLRATMDWSHDLLDERERALFRRLGIFVKGFTLDGAVAVGGDPELDALDVMTSLVDKSLVLAEPDGDALRYRLLESTRIYALEKLEAAGERDVCAERHFHYLRGLFIEAKARYERTGRDVELDDLFAAELEDVRAALDWSANSSQGGELLLTIGARWDGLGFEREGLERIEAFLEAQPDPDPRTLAGLWTAVAGLTGNIGSIRVSFEAATRALAAARTGADSRLLANALCQYALSAAALLRMEDAEEALSEAEGMPDGSAALRLRLLSVRAFLSAQVDDYEAAGPVYDQLRSEHRRLGNTHGEHGAGISVADNRHARGKTDLAIEIAREVLPGLRVHRERKQLALLLMNLAGYLNAVDQLPEACAAAREALRELAPLGPDNALAANAIEHLALAIALGGNVSRAVLFAGYADAATRRHGLQREFTERKTHDRLMALLGMNFAADELVRRLAEGAALAPEAALALALEEP